MTGPTVQAAGHPARDDDAVDPRHQARRGRPGPAARGRRGHRDAGRVVWALRAASWPIGSSVDPPTAYFVFQTVLGAWPIAARAARRVPGEGRPRGQARHHLDRAGRRLRGQADARSAPRAASGSVGRWPATPGSPASQPAERAINLAAKLLQLTLPGVPDVYQGSEQTSYSLVDPDNRRPVDFDRRGATAGRARRRARDRDGLDDDKLWVTSRALRLRRARPDAFGPDVGLPAARPVDAARRSASCAAATGRSPW